MDSGSPARRSSSWARPLASAALASAAALVIIGVTSDGWKLEEHPGLRIRLGPRSMSLCDASGCRRVEYARAARAVSGAPAVRPPDATDALERESAETVAGRMAFLRRKGLQLIWPAGLGALWFAGLSILLLAAGGRSPRAWSVRGFVTFTALLVGGALAILAYVFVDGISHCLAPHVDVRWGTSAFLTLAGCGLALVGGVVAGVGKEG